VQVRIQSDECADASIAVGTLSGFTAFVTTDNKVATAKGFHSEISFGSMTESDPFGYFAYIDIAEGPGFCEQPICVKGINITPPGYPGVMISISSSAPLSERNRFLALNTACFARLGGCKCARDLLPVPEVR
jgi:hypothetical protein